MCLCNLCLLIFSTGFTLDHETSKQLNHATMCDMVDRYVNDDEVVVVNTKRMGIKKNIQRELKNFVSRKRFRVVNKKRVIRKDFVCVPYGFDSCSLRE